MSKSATFGVIVGNRGFFPDILARDGREEILRVLEKEGYGAVCLTPEDTKFGVGGNASGCRTSAPTSSASIAMRSTACW